ncbi:MAG TPA: DivIVA domain-containing protein, partial [Ornithinibacter sp.]|nr:DivIVA domain-containing protein [Ornithinibacter sp.]
MALTPEDVLNKTFTQTQFRRGYDEREVDDFLDDIVAEMRRMTKESDDLRGDLNSCREGKGMTAVVARQDA